MKLHPFDDCVRAAVKLHLEKGATFFMQFNCANCGAKLTTNVPNKFFEKGICEECRHVTDVKHDGCNYMLTFGVSR